jgi:hypothetical protein
LVEHFPEEEGVVGSSPTLSTANKSSNRHVAAFIIAVAQGSGSKGAVLFSSLKERKTMSWDHEHLIELNEVKLSLGIRCYNPHEKSTHHHRYCAWWHLLYPTN